MAKVWHIPSTGDYYVRNVISFYHKKKGDPQWREVLSSDEVKEMMSRINSSKDAHIPQPEDRDILLGELEKQFGIEIEFDEGFEIKDALNRLFK